MPYIWLSKVLEIYEVAPSLINLLRTLKSQLSTELSSSDKNNAIETGLVKIEKGIYQGDSVNPLWFCLALNPFSYMFNISYSIKANSSTECRVTYLLYMDDIKLYVSRSRPINNLPPIVDVFSKDIRMGLGLEKCKIPTIIREKQGTNTFKL